MTDASIEAILEHRLLLPSHLVVPVGSHDRYRDASDKLLVHRIACEVGLGIAETAVVEAPTDPAPEDRRLFPGVLKPHRSVVGTRPRMKVGVTHVGDAVECALRLRALPAEAFPVLVQRRVHGPGEGFFTMRIAGSPAAYFAHRRLRERPPAGGASVLRESIALHPDLRERCDAVLDRLGWTGVAMVECKRDEVYGGWRVIEINARFWGSLQLAIDAGVDFPALLAESVVSGSIAPPRQWRTGVRSRWEWGDVDNLLLRLLRSRSRLNLEPDFPGRMRALLDFVVHRPGRDHLEVLRLLDPLPFLVESARRAGWGH